LGNGTVVRNAAVDLDRTQVAAVVEEERPVAPRSLSRRLASAEEDGPIAGAAVHLSLKEQRLQRLQAQRLRLKEQPAASAELREVEDGEVEGGAVHEAGSQSVAVAVVECAVVLEPKQAVCMVAANLTAEGDRAPVCVAVNFKDEEQPAGDVVGEVEDREVEEAASPAATEAVVESLDAMQAPCRLGPEETLPSPQAQSLAGEGLKPGFGDLNIECLAQRLLRPNEQAWRDAFKNLVQRFDMHSSTVVVDALRKNDGHAGRTAQALRKLAASSVVTTPVKAVASQPKEADLSGSAGNLKESIEGDSTADLIADSKVPSLMEANLQELQDCST